jgi:branched-chain amino acid transport system substrate-binding protein
MKRFIFILAFFLSACGDSSVTVFNNIDDDEIYIGVVYPVAQRYLDTYLYKGIEFAVERVNAEGGVLGRELRTIIRDDENDAHLAMQIANTFYEQGITAVVGHWSTNICYFLVDVYQENRVVMITPAATGTNLFEYYCHYVYRMSANHNVYAEAIATHISEAGLSRVAIFYSDDEYGTDFAALLERELSRHDVLVTDRVTGITQASIDTIMERWRAFGTDGVIIAALMPAMVEPIRLINSVNPNFPIFGADNFDRTNIYDILGHHTEAMYIATFSPCSLDGEFLEAFRATYGHDPDIRAVSGYAAVRLIADAMNATGTTDSAAIADFISTLDNHPSIFGPLTYNTSNQEFENFNIVVRGLGD